jgi:hypothetical protein
MKTQQEKLKRQIVTIVKRSGLPIRAQSIADQIALPETIILSDLLTDLVAEARLSRSYTLLADGDLDYAYDLSA